jgi:hypothetical protein
VNSKPLGTSLIPFYSLGGIKQTLSSVVCLSSYQGKNTPLWKHTRDLINICERMNDSRPGWQRATLAKNREMFGADWFEEASLSAEA